MWTRVIQSDDDTSCIFGVPTLGTGQELAASMFTSGTEISAGKLALPIVRPGVIQPISMAMDIIPILTEKAADVFTEELGDYVQLLACNPVDGKALWVANILSVIDCLDRAHSKAEFYPPNYPLRHLANKVKIAFELVLDESKALSHKVFRVKDDELKLIITTAFLDLLTVRGVTGLRVGNMPKYRAG